MVEQKLKEKKYSIEEYLKLEEKAEFKSEYDNGWIRPVQAMGGGSLNHGIIGANILIELGNKIQVNQLQCTLTNSEVKVFIEKADCFVYPDAQVFCGPPVYHPHDKNAITNPMLIVEVLSKSTANYDRSKKFVKYRSLDSFKEYVLINQYEPIVDVLFRETNNSWKMHTYIGLEKTIELNSLEIKIEMKDLYKGVQDLQDPSLSLNLK